METPESKLSRVLVQPSGGVQQIPRGLGDTPRASNSMFLAAYQRYTAMLVYMVALHGLQRKHL